MRKRYFCIRSFFASAIILAAMGIAFLSQPAQAQTTYGSITGSVTDPSGATIAGAQVTLTNVGTSEKRTQPTGSDGLFLFVNLIPGSYGIDVEKPGFKRYSRPQITVDVNQTVHVDASLQVGTVQETVEVTAET